MPASVCTLLPNSTTFSLFDGCRLCASLSLSLSQSIEGSEAKTRACHGSVCADLNGCYAFGQAVEKGLKLVNL
jgi:hypothetical protein